MNPVSMGMHNRESDAPASRDPSYPSHHYDAARVLLVDDQPEILWPLINFMEKEGHIVRVAERGMEALRTIPDYGPHIVFLDVKMPGMNGLEALKRIRESYPEIIVFILTGHESIKDAVQAIKTGAYDYFTKPYHLEEIKFSIMRALEDKRLKEEVVMLRKRLQERFNFSSIVTADPQMFHLFDKLRKVAPSDLSVLITGENGTGKELVAQAIHYNSLRKDGPFTPMDCATIPETLFESQVFGFERGAFTGADHKQKGLFEMAQGGTLFLDELGNLRSDFQSKLLRVMQERRIIPLGGKDYIDLNLRLISATNTDLEAARDKGHFREDLFFRINQFHIHLPPLRERLNDVKLLAQHFSQEAAQERGVPVQEISSEAMDILAHYTWPGNVRQLKNVINGASVMAEEKILPEHLPPQLLNRHLTGKGVRLSLFIPSRSTLKRMEQEVLSQANRYYIERVLIESDYQIRQASDWLDISQRTLGKKMEEYAITPKTDTDDPVCAGVEAFLNPGTTLKDLNKRIGSELERALIVQALREYRGNKSKTARALGVDYKTLLAKMREFSINEDDVDHARLPDWLEEVSTHDQCGKFKEIVARFREKMEQRLIMLTLRHTRWDKAKASRALGIDYKTLYNKLRKYGLE
ncbi:MAG: sigma 54-interacting transcriptional regulator [bacterium]